MTELAEKLLAIHHSLADAEIEHAFGGAISLGYWTLDPRGTSHIDVNVFIAAEKCLVALEALPEGVPYDQVAIDGIVRDGQRRLRWGEVPIDLFFNNLPFHERVAKNVAVVPFAGEQIPVLGAVELATFKAMFNRYRDWGDIERMIEAEMLDVDSVREWIANAVGEDDQRIERLDELVSQYSG